MSFYHFTTVHHLPSITTNGYLKPTESNVSYRTEHAGPDVVWLLDTPNPGSTDDLVHGLPLIKRQVRIEVNVPAIRWLDWEYTAEMEEIWFAAMTQVGGCESWYLYPGPIARENWFNIAIREDPLSEKWEVYDAQTQCRVSA